MLALDTLSNTRRTQKPICLSYNQTATSLGLQEKDTKASQSLRHADSASRLRPLLIFQGHLSLFSRSCSGKYFVAWYLYGWYSTSVGSSDPHKSAMHNSILSPLVSKFSPSCVYWSTNSDHLYLHIPSKCRKHTDFHGSRWLWGIGSRCGRSVGIWSGRAPCRGSGSRTWWSICVRALSEIMLLLLRFTFWLKLFFGPCTLSSRLRCQVFIQF